MDYRVYNKIFYDNNYVIDNTSRIIIREYIRDNINYFFKYTVKAEERPEHIAFDFYGDSKLNWIILLANEVIDPFYDWVMNYSVFLKFLESKYLPDNLTSSDWHHFENDQGVTIPDPGNDIDRARYGISNLDFYLNQTKMYVKNGKRIQEPNNQVDRDLFRITNFTYEENLNDSKREINIPVPELIDNVERDLLALLN